MRLFDFVIEPRFGTTVRELAATVLGTSVLFVKLTCPFIGFVFKIFNLGLAPFGLFFGPSVLTWVWTWVEIKSAPKGAYLLSTWRKR